MNSIKRRLSFANIIACIALFAALSGGVAWAAGSIGSKQIKDHSITGKDIKKGSIPLTALKKIPAGTPGPAGAPGSALAYAHVLANGALDTANSKNISATKQVGSGGYYCVTPSVAVHGSVVSGDGGTTPAVYNSSFEDPLTSCPEGAAVVEVFRLEGGTFKSPQRQFFIVFN